MLTAIPLLAAGEQRPALGVPGDSSVFSSFEALAWRAVACAAEDRRASPDSAGHAKLAWFRDRRQRYHLPISTWTCYRVFRA